MNSIFKYLRALRDRKHSRASISLTTPVSGSIRRLGMGRSWLAIAASLGAVLASVAQLSNAATPARPEFWMQDIADQIADVPLRGIAMPGTHDAAMYYFPLDQTYADIARTQTVDLGGQLAAGARWLDMRFLYINNTTCPKVTSGSETLSNVNHTGWYMFGHGGICTNVTLYDALDQIRSFLVLHPKEIVILRMQRLGQGLDSSVTDAFRAQMVAHLTNSVTGNSMIYDDPTACVLGGGTWLGTACDDPTAMINPQDVTPRQLVSTSARVILLWRESALAGPFVGGANASEPSVESQAGYYDADNGTGSPGTELQYLETGTPDNIPGLYRSRPAWQSWSSDPKMIFQSASTTPYGKPVLPLGMLGPVYEAFAFNPVLTSLLEGTLKSDAVAAGDDLSSLSATNAVCAPSPKPADCAASYFDWRPYSGNVVELDHIGGGGTAEAVIARNDEQWGKLPAGINGISALGAGGGSVYKIDASPVSALWVWTPSSRLWAPVSNGAGGQQTGVRVAVDGSGSPLVVNAAGQILRRTISGSWFTITGLSATDIATGPEGSLWAIGADGKIYKNVLSAWVAFPGVLGSRIALDNAGVPWVISTGGQVYRYITGNWTWADCGCTATAIAIGGLNSIWIVSSETFTDITASKLVSLTRKWNGSSWDRYHSGGGVALAVDLSGSPWLATFYGSLQTPLLLQGKLRDLLPGALPLSIASSSVYVTHGAASPLYNVVLSITNQTSQTFTGPFALVPRDLTTGIPFVNSSATFHGLQAYVPATASFAPGQVVYVTLSFAGGPVKFVPQIFVASN